MSDLDIVNLENPGAMESAIALVLRAALKVATLDPAASNSVVAIDGSGNMVKTNAADLEVQKFANADTALTNLGVSAFIKTLLNDVDAATARSTLGAQAADATLTGLAGTTTAANKLIYATGVDTFSTADLTAAARALLDDADASAMLTTLGVSSFVKSLLDDADAATLRNTIGAQAADATLTGLAGTTTAANKLIYATGVDTFAATDITAQGRALLDDVDASAMQSTLGISTYIKTLLDDTDAAGARSTIGAQAADATLTALAGIATLANKLIYATGADAFATTDFTAAARALLDDADASAMLTTLGLSAFVKSLMSAGDQSAFLTALGISTTYLLPVGSIIPFMGSTPPGGWLECNGAEVSRSTYANLFNALSVSLVGNFSGADRTLLITNGINVLDAGILYNFIEGGAIPAGNRAGPVNNGSSVYTDRITVAASGIIAAASGVAVRAFRGAGLGNGSTTFNLPDLRGEFLRGWDHARGVDTGLATFQPRGLGGDYQRQSIQAHSHRVDFNTSANTGTSGGGNRVSNILAAGSGSEMVQTGDDPTLTTGDSYQVDETRPRNVSVMYCIKT